jgi:phosphate transport system protein
MARIEYQQSLEALEASLQEEGAVVLRSVRGAVDALESQDVELCDEVVAFDDEVDTRYHSIERSIEQLLAQQAPVATDLRLVLAVLHCAIHLERIGDQAVTIAKLTKLSASLEQRHDLVEGLREMGDRAEAMVRISLDAFAARDVSSPRGASSGSATTPSTSASRPSSSSRVSSTSSRTRPIDLDHRIATSR